MNDSLRLSEEERVTLKFMLHLDNIKSNSVDIEATERPSLILKHKELLQGFEKATASNKTELASLKDICRYNFIPCNGILLLDSLIVERQKFAEKIIGLSLIGKHDEALALVNTGEGILLRNSIKIQDGKLGNLGRGLLDRQKTQHEEEAKKTEELFGASGLIAFILIAYTFFKILQDDNLKRKLAKQNEFLAEVVNKTSDAVVTFDQHHIVTYWNKAAENMYGKKADDVIGKKSDFVFGVRNNPDEVKIITEHLKKEGQWSGELKDTHANGKPMYVLVSLTVLRNEEGEIIRYISININITEQKKATKKIAELAEELKILNDSLQDKVAEQTAKLTALIEHTPAYLCEIDREGIILTLNKPYGTDTKKEDIIGTPFYTWDINEAHADKIKSIIEYVFITNQSYYYEYNVPGLQNNTYYYSSNYTPVIINDKTESIIITVYDITKQKKTEEELKKLAVIMNHSEIFVGIMDMDFKIDYLNMAAKKRLGVTEDEDIKMIDAVDFFRDDKKFDEQIIAEVFNTGKWVGEDILLTRTKEEIPIMEVLMLHKNEQGEPRFISSTSIDITELKQKEEELKNLTSIIENSPAYVSMIDLNKNFIYANHAFRDAFGIEEDEDITTFNEANFRGISTLEIINDGNEENLKNSKWMGTNTYVSRSGKAIPVLQVLVLHKNDKGEPHRISMTAIDLSVQRKTEKELKKMNVELRYLSRHLQKVREEERKEIAREIHDEFGQNLTVLKMNAAWLKKHLDTEENKGKDKVHEKLDELMEIADDTIQTSRKLYNSLHPSMLDDIGITAAVEWQAKTFTKSSGVIVEFHSNIQDEKFSQNISIGLFRICQESLTNVMRHAKATQVIIDITKKENTIVLNIEDNGKGFDVSKINTKNSHGLLGMRERVYAMNGTLDIQSTEDKGTKIIVTVPVAETP